MGVTETVLVGIACALAQGSPDAQKAKDILNEQDQQRVEKIESSGVCREHEAYIQQSQNENSQDNIIHVRSCQSCLQTSTAGD